MAPPLRTASDGLFLGRFGPCGSSVCALRGWRTPGCVRRRVLLCVAPGAWCVGRRLGRTVGIAVLVGPYQIHVLAAAVVCLFGTAFVMVQQRRAKACGRAQAATRPLLGRFTAVAVALALALLALTFWLEPPL